jgi:hypothetical protein
VLIVWCLIHSDRCLSRSRDFIIAQKATPHKLSGNCRRLAQSTAANDGAEDHLISAIFLASGKMRLGDE